MPAFFSRLAGRSRVIAGAEELSHLLQQAGRQEQGHRVQGSQLCTRLLQHRLGGHLDGVLDPIQAIDGVPDLMRSHMPHDGPHLRSKHTAREPE